MREKLVKEWIYKAEEDFEEAKEALENAKDIRRFIKEKIGEKD